MKTIIALIRKDYLDGKNGYFTTPLVLASVMVGLVLLAALGVGDLNISLGFEKGVQAREASLGELIRTLEERVAAGEANAAKLPVGMTFFYWALSLLPAIALPFVIFFSLLGSLYDERQDKSILFWKSMPVSDGEEVLAKFLMSTLGAMLVFFAVMIVAQIVAMVLLSLIAVFQGASPAILWPLGALISSWVAVIPYSLLAVLWILPVFGWLLLVSAYAKKLPVLYAILPPVVFIVLEELFRGTNYIGSWFGLHIIGWQEKIGLWKLGHDYTPEEVFASIIGSNLLQSYGNSFTSPSFYLGLVIAGGFFMAAVELRKRYSS